MMVFLIKYRIPVIILFYLFQFAWFSTNSNLLAIEEMGFLAWISLLFLTGFWLSLLLDMINSGIYHKTFWLFSMLILPWLAPSFYLFQRKKLNRLQTSVYYRRKKID